MEFLDQFPHTIDDKGRLVLPAAFRSAFAEGGFMTYMGRSVGLFTAEGFEKHRRRLNLDPAFTRRDLQHLLGLSSAFTPDAQHRISITPKLREHIGLVREITSAGQGSHVAVYPRDVWETQETATLDPDAIEGALAAKFDDADFL